MGLISHLELCELVEQGVIDAHPENINGSSIDLTLHKTIRTEGYPRFEKVVSIGNKENISTDEHEMGEGGFVIMPGQFILASSQEVFNLPNNIAAEYVLKSSMARNGLNHMLAGFCDPGWSNSRLTLELKNETQRHELLIKPGMKIGQIKFYRVEPVPDHASYAVTGQYNNQQKVQESKGIR